MHSLGAVKSRAALRVAAVMVLALLVAACASGARPGAMTVEVASDRIIPDSAPLRNAIKVGTVTGGSETNPLWKSNVADSDFRQALEQSLSLHAMLALSSSRYILNAEMLSLDQPFAGFDMKVTAKVHYTLLSQPDQAVKWDQTLETPYTANFSDAFVGSERLRLANEGAMRENIKAVLDQLVASAPASLATGR